MFAEARGPRARREHVAGLRRVAGGVAQHLGHRETDVVAASLERPGDRLPGELGVARLVLGDLFERGTDGGIGRARELLDDEERAHRLADAALLRGGAREIDEARRAERVAIERKRSRPDVALGVGAGEREAERRVAHLVERRLVRARDELGRRADGHQLERESTERRDRGVLGERVASPRVRERVALDTRQGRERRRGERAAPAARSRRGGVGPTSIADLDARRPRRAVHHEGPAVAAHVLLGDEVTAPTAAVDRAAVDRAHVGARLARHDVHRRVVLIGAAVAERLNAFGELVRRRDGGAGRDTGRREGAAAARAVRHSAADALERARAAGAALPVRVDDRRRAPERTGEERGPDDAEEPAPERATEDRGRVHVEPLVRKLTLQITRAKREAGRVPGPVCRDSRPISRVAVSASRAAWCRAGSPSRAARRSGSTTSFANRRLFGRTVPCGRAGSSSRRGARS